VVGTVSPDDHAAPAADSGVTGESTLRARGRKSSVAGAGLPGTSPHLDEKLRSIGVEPERLSVLKFGRRAPAARLPGWLWRMFLGLALWLASLLARRGDYGAAEALAAPAALLIGLLILQAACEALVSATERLAARFRWNHYVAGTLAEIISTTPELVVILFLIPVSPTAAVIITTITIYNNALVFSLYSFFLPKDRQGRFLMPRPITEAGTQILVGGGAMGLILGLTLLTLKSTEQEKTSFQVLDLVFISFVLLAIFAVYIYKLIVSYAAEEAEVREGLSMSDAEVEQRLEMVYEDVRPSSFAAIAAFFLLGLVGAFAGGEQVSTFAETMIRDLDINPILTAFILAVFAGMSEYVILWQSHRKQEYGIALANAFGGITQVMFLVLPFTLLSIAFYQSFVNAQHPELPLQFSLAVTFLLLFLFPTFYTLSALLENDHTLGILDTVIMTGIFLLLIMLLATYGGGLL
jgi:hypothetical protein